MAKTVVKAELSAAQEISLLNRYGRKCSPETLVKRALAEVLRQQAEDIPVFLGKEEYEAKVKAEAEAKRLADIEAARLPPEVEALISRFRSGVAFVDLEGREVTALEPNDDVDMEEAAPVVAQFDADNSEWYPIALSEIQTAADWQEKQRRGEVPDA